MTNSTPPPVAPPLYKLPNGPRTEPHVSRIFHRYTSLDIVENERVVDANRHWHNHRTPLETRLNLTEDAKSQPVEEIRKRLKERANIGSIPALAPLVRVHDPPMQERSLGGSDEWDADIRWFWHPYAEFVQASLMQPSAVKSVDVSWSPGTDTLSTGRLNWMHLPPLRISLQFQEQQFEDCEDDNQASRKYNEALATVRKRLRAITAETNYQRWSPRITRVTDRTDVLADMDMVDQLSTASEYEETYLLTIERPIEKTDERSTVVRADASNLETILNEKRDRLGDLSKVQLTVTSPPYANAIDYDAHLADTDEDWSGVSTSDNVDAWLSDQKEVFDEVYTVTREGGFCAIVIAPVRSEKSTVVPIHEHFGRMMADIGWNRHQPGTIVWDKTTSRDGGFQTTAQHPYPTYTYLNEQVEFIQLWRKGDVVNQKDEKSKFELSELMTKEVANNVWHVAPVPHNASGNDHPCPFPEELAHRLTILYSNKGDLVIDPYAGSGTTLSVADALDRVAFGVEIRGAYVGEAEHRLSFESYQRTSQKVPEYAEVDPQETGSEQSSLEKYTAD